VPYPETGLLAALLAGSGVRSYPPGLLTGPAVGQVADRLHRVFAAAGPEERAGLVNGLLAETGVRPALPAAAALTLRRRLAGHDPARVGVCSGRRCADAYIDTSPRGQRRFCSVTCQNRARVAAWRQRRGG